MKQGKLHARIAAAALALATCGSALAQSGIQVVVNNEPVVFRGVGPQTMNGRVLVPLRGVLEKLGAYVDWQPAGQLVTATRGDIDISLRVGSRNAQVNGRTVMLDVPAMIVRGSTMVPLRFMGEALGADVRWEREQYAVIINTNPVDVIEPDRPNPPARPIMINSFEIDRSGWLEPGAVVRFTLRGTAGGDASLNIPGVQRDIPMIERTSGVYEATWTVPSNRERLNASRINAIARLRIGNEERLIQSATVISVDTTAPMIRSMTPELDARISTTRPTISAVFEDEVGSGVDRRSVRLFVDDRDVTDQATITDDFVTYRPATALRSGEHEVRLVAEDVAGNRAEKAWQFRIDDRGADVIQSFDVTGIENARPGDVIRFTLTAEPGGRATFTLGNLVRNRAMTEVRSGRYEGTYTVRRGDVFDADAITARFVARSGEVYTIEASDRFPLSTSPLDAPRITSPRADESVRDPLIIAGTAPRNARVMIRVDYSTDVAGAIRLKGTISEVVVVADESGRFETQPIGLDTLVKGSDTRYTITAVTLGSNGRKSDETSIIVRR